MTVTDQIKILDNKTKSNQDLGHKPRVFEKAKFEYFTSGMTLINSTKSKRNKHKVYNKNKQNKFLTYNQQHSFTKFKDIDGFEELSLDSMYKRLNDFKKNLIRLKLFIHKKF